MKTQNTYQSKIATIVYKNYTENVDMNNEFFKQEELDALFESDKDILRIKYYRNGMFLGELMRQNLVLPVEKVYTPLQAASQIGKMDRSIGKIQDTMEYEAGHDWYERKLRNETKSRKIQELYNKIDKYKKFLTKEIYEQELECDMCCTWEDYMNIEED